MNPFPMKLLVGILVAVQLTGLASAICYRTGLPGVPLKRVTFSNGTVRCLEGFYCPNLDPDNASTFPVVCPPSNECSEDRTRGKTCDEPQGDYEPRLVPEGSYSDDGRTLKDCPSGSFCVAGSVEPQKCSPLSICPSGAAKQQPIGELVWLVLALIVLFVVVRVYRAKFAFSSLDHDRSGFNISSAATTPRNNSLSGSATSSDGGDGSGNRSEKVQLLCDGFKRRRGGIKPLKFTFNNLKVSLPDTSKGKADGKVLLNDVSGHFSPGKVTAIMGPSGAGKTTLMSTLLGKLPAHVTRSGHLHVNGEHAQISKVRHMIGFVPQDDVLHTELSTYKNLYYSSEIRLPREWTDTERHLFRSAVIDILGLTEARDVVIGDAQARGISGGQRKRASIGLELAAAPLAMFLDEPTSGLDSFASMELCLLLREIALQTHLCVAMVIHQPRVEIWNALDEVLILAAGGFTVYQGPQQEAQLYFDIHCGVQFSSEVNPADAIMDAVAERPDELIAAWKKLSAGRSTSNVSFQKKPETQPQPQSVLPQDEQPETPQPPMPLLQVPSCLLKQLRDEGEIAKSGFTPPERELVPPRSNSVHKYKKESEQQRLQKLLWDDSDDDLGLPNAQPPSLKQDDVPDPFASLVDTVVPPLQSPMSPSTAVDVDVDEDQATQEWLGASFGRQILLSHNRAVEKQLTIMQPFIVEILVASLLGIILGQAKMQFTHKSTFRDPYKQISIAPNDAMLPQLSLYSLMSLSIGGASAGVRVLGEPMLQFYREAAAGHNRLAFFLGSVWAATYRIGLCSYAFSTFDYVLPGAGFSFGEFYVTYLMAYYCMYAIAAPVSIVSSKRNAPLLACLVGITCAIFSGFVDYPLWMKRLSFGFYTAQTIQLLNDSTLRSGFDSSYGMWGWGDMATGWAVLINLFWGSTVYALGYILLISANREKQR